MRFQLHAAGVAAVLVAQRREQRAVAAADVEHPAAGRDMPGDQRQVGAKFAGLHPHWLRNPAITRSSAGTSSRKLSCPNGADSSTKLTGAPAAFSACAILRDSGVG